MKKASLVQVLVLLTTLQVYGQSQYNEDCSMDQSGFNLTQNVDLLDYLTVSDTSCHQSGILIIIPDMTFDCHGSISSWSGLLSIEADSMLSQMVDLEICFQVWRPQGNSFDLVGSDLLVFDSLDIEDTVLPPTSTNVSRSYFAFVEKEGNWTSDPENIGISFQPGDVVGCYIHSAGSSEEQALGLAFRNASLGDEEEMELMVYSVDSRDLCARTPTLIPSVVPLIYPHYETDFGFSFDELGSGSTQAYSNSSSLSSSSLEIHICNDKPTCSPEETGDKTVKGLFAVIAATCVLLVCIIGLSINIATLCVMRRNSKRQRQRRALLRSNRLEANCPFIRFSEEFNKLEDGDQPVLENLTSLADFLQYSMYNEENADSNRMSWV